MKEIIRNVFTAILNAYKNDNEDSSFICLNIDYIIWHESEENRKAKDFMIYNKPSETKYPEIYENKYYQKYLDGDDVCNAWWHCKFSLEEQRNEMKVERIKYLTILVENFDTLWVEFQEILTTNSLSY